MGGGSAERAMRVVRYKSAKYTIERPLHLGAALAGASTDARRRPTRGYGLPLGEAFQLRDDVLGVFGDPAETGKPAGDDLREGKRTVLVATARRGRLARPQAAVLRRQLGDPALDAAGVEALREIIVDTGALAHVEALHRGAHRRSASTRSTPLAVADDAAARCCAGSPSPPPPARSDRPRRTARVLAESARGPGPHARRSRATAPRDARRPGGRAVVQPWWPTALGYRHRVGRTCGSYRDGRSPASSTSLAVYPTGSGYEPGPAARRSLYPPFAAAASSCRSRVVHGNGSATTTWWLSPSSAWSGCVAPSVRARTSADASRSAAAPRPFCSR